MSKQEHTPGPWFILDGAILCDQVNDYGNFHIARFDRGDNPNTPEDLANAKLIAASPDLLEAYRDLWVQTENGTVGDNFFELRAKFRNLMAKATIIINAATGEPL